MADKFLEAYPWALRATQFDDDGLDPEERQAFEKAHGQRPAPAWVPPKSQWAQGPWMTEPDLVEWRAANIPYPLMIARGGMGALCGYVGVPKGHPFHGDSGRVETQHINWSSRCTGIFMPTGEPPDCWWLGFDCGHWHQYSPRMEAGNRWMNEFMTSAGFEPVEFPMAPHAHYVSIEECRRLTGVVALELLEIAKNTH